MNQESGFSGYLGAKKTEVRIIPNFFLPGLCQDIIRFCCFCDVCQRTVKRGSVKKVPLGSMPLINMPFKRVAFYIVGLMLYLIITVGLLNKCCPIRISVLVRMHAECFQPTQYKGSYQYAIPSHLQWILRDETEP